MLSVTPPLVWCCHSNCLLPSLPGSGLQWEAIWLSRHILHHHHCHSGARHWNSFICQYGVSFVSSWCDLHHRLVNAMLCVIINHVIRRLHYTAYIMTLETAPRSQLPLPVLSSGRLTPAPIREYSETCIKRPLDFVVSQDRWSFMTGLINMIL